MALTIGKYIHHCLSTDPDLVEVTEGRIYPTHVREQGTPVTPYLIYWVESAKEQSTKDGIYGDTNQVSIMVVAKDYEEKMDILPLVRHAMQDGMKTWNAGQVSGITTPDELPFTIDDQTMSLGADEWDLETGFDTSTFSYTIETDDNNE